MMRHNGKILILLFIAVVLPLCVMSVCGAESSADGSALLPDEVVVCDVSGGSESGLDAQEQLAEEGSGYLRNDLIVEDLEGTEGAWSQTEPEGAKNKWIPTEPESEEEKWIQKESEGTEDTWIWTEPEDLEDSSWPDSGNTADEWILADPEISEDELLEIETDGPEEETAEMVPDELASQFRVLPSFTIPDQLYTGEPVTPEPVLYDQGEKLTLDVDYENVTYQNNIETGTASVTVYGKGQYFGKSTATFEIRRSLEKELPETLSRTSIDLYYWYAVRQTDISFITVPGLSADEYEIIFPEDYSTAGIVTLTVVGKGDYEGQTKEYPLEVRLIDLNNMDLEFSVRGNDRSGYFAYTGEEVCPEGAIYHGSDEYDIWVMLGDEYEGKVKPYYLQKGRDYTLTYEDNIEQGVATVIFHGIGNCTGEAVAEFRIAKRHQVTLTNDSAIRLTETSSSAIAETNENGAWVYEGQALGEIYVSDWKTLRSFALESQDERRTFLGWSTDPEGYEAMNLEGVFPAGDVTLYAKWSYETSIYLDNNGNKRYASQPDRSEVLIPEGSPLYPYLPVYSDEDDPTSENRYRLLGWNTRPDGTGTWGEKLRATEKRDGLVLYAIWEKKVKVTLNSGDGYFDDISYSYNSQTGQYDAANHKVYYEKERYLSKGSWMTEDAFQSWTYNCYSNRDDNVLAGWSLTNGGEIIDLENFCPTMDVTLYAVFRPSYTVIFRGDEQWEVRIWNDREQQYGAFSLKVGEGAWLGSVRGDVYHDEDLEWFLEWADNAVSTTFLNKKLSGWRNVSDGKVYSQAELRTYVVRQDETFVPVWKEGYPVTLHTNGYGGFLRRNGGKEEYLEAVTVNSLRISSTSPSSLMTGTQARYCFAGYSDTPDSGQIRDFSTDPITVSQDLYAVWRKTCRVVWIMGKNRVETKNLPEGTALPQKEPKDFYSYYEYGERVPFLGWSLTEGGTALTAEEYASLKVKNGLVLFAVWDVEIEKDPEVNGGQNAGGNAGAGTSPNVPPSAGSATDNSGTGASQSGTSSAAGGPAAAGMPVTQTGSTAAGTPGTETGSAAGTSAAATGSGATTYGAAIRSVEGAVTGTKKDLDFPGSSYSPLRLYGRPLSKSAVRLSWQTVPGAVEYLVFGGKSGEKMTLLAQGNITSWTHGKLKKGTYYKYVVAALFGDNAGTNPAILSRTVYVTTKGGKAANWSRLKSPKKTIRMKTGKTKKLQVNASSGRKKVKKFRGLSFESTNSAVASVDRRGNIRTHKKGTCAIWVYTQSGLALKMKVKVR